MHLINVINMIMRWLARLFRDRQIRRACHRLALIALRSDRPLFLCGRLWVHNWAGRHIAKVVWIVLSGDGHQVLL